MLVQWVHTHVGRGEGLGIDFLRTYLMNATLSNVFLLHSASRLKIIAFNDGNTIKFEILCTGSCLQVMRVFRL
jgi:hypothetical protein